MNEFTSIDHSEIFLSLVKGNETLQELWDAQGERQQYTFWPITHYFVSSLYGTPHPEELDVWFKWKHGDVEDIGSIWPSENMWVYSKSLLSSQQTY